MTVHTAFPDLLGRDDTNHAPWEVTTGRMARGMAWTALGEKKMSVPHGDTDNERSVRAHEMMHAKVSPAPEQMVAWLDRKRATVEAHTAAEELRVNTLIKRKGFNVDCLTDGSETHDGEQIALNNMWREAVLATAAYGNTGRIKAFLVGVRRHNPEWAKSLRAIHDRVVKEIDKVPTDQLASTAALSNHNPLAPYGYRWTEAVAMLLDNLASPPEQETEQNDTPATENNEPAPPPVSEAEAKKMAVLPDTAFWDDIRWSHPARTRRAPGGIGTKKRPAAIGRTPTRITRLTTDPYQRVFDRKVRGKGGVVLIDASGSMRLTREGVMAVVEAAPGCTVAMYCGGVEARKAGLPNLWLLADKGTMVDEIPERHKGNAIDLPALEWAISAKQRSDSPVIWVTDGLCHGPGQRYTDAAGVSCANTVLRHNVIVRPTINTAVEALNQWTGSRRPARWYPRPWRESWRKMFGGRELHNQIDLA